MQRRSFRSVEIYLSGQLLFIFLQFLMFCMLYRASAIFDVYLVLHNLVLIPASACPILFLRFQRSFTKYSHSRQKISQVFKFPKNFFSPANVWQFLTQRKGR